MALSEGRVIASAAAGPEGFVVVSRSVEGAASSMMHASGDGLDWFEAPGPADAVVATAPIGPDWVAVDGTLGEGENGDVGLGQWPGLDGVGLDPTPVGVYRRRGYVHRVHLAPRQQRQIRGRLHRLVVPVRRRPCPTFRRRAYHGGRRYLGGASIHRGRARRGSAPLEARP